MIDFAEHEIKNLGGRPVKWIKYPLVTNLHDYNELKGRLKDDGKLLEWVKFLQNQGCPYQLKINQYLTRTKNKRYIVFCNNSIILGK